jgi:hypothetical protein
MLKQIVRITMRSKVMYESVLGSFVGFVYSVVRTLWFQPFERKSARPVRRALDADPAFSRIGSGGCRNGEGKYVGAIDEQIAQIPRMIPILIQVDPAFGSGESVRTGDEDKSYIMSHALRPTRKARLPVPSVSRMIG